MQTMTMIFEDIQFTATRRNNTWDVIQCCPLSGKEIEFQVNDEEFAATLALIIAGDAIIGKDLQELGERMVKKQEDTNFRMIP